MKSISKSFMNGRGLFEIMPKAGCILIPTIIVTPHYKCIALCWLCAEISFDFVPKDTYKYGR